MSLWRLVCSRWFIFGHSAIGPNKAHLVVDLNNIRDSRHLIVDATVRIVFSLAFFSSRGQTVGVAVWMSIILYILLTPDIYVLTSCILILTYDVCTLASDIHALTGGIHALAFGKYICWYVTSARWHQSSMTWYLIYPRWMTIQCKQTSTSRYMFPDAWRFPVDW